MSDDVMCAEHLLRNAHDEIDGSRNSRIFEGLVILENIIAKMMNLWYP